MSVLDEFRDAEKRVAQRLKELQPAVSEYRELEVVAQRVGIEIPSAAPARTTRRRRRKSSAAPEKRTGAMRRANGSRRSVPGRREQLLLDLIRERPGITVAEAGKAMSVDPTGLYRVVNRLEQRGEVRKTGRELHPAATA